MVRMICKVLIITIQHSKCRHKGNDLPGSSCRVVPISFAFANDKANIITTRDMSTRCIGSFIFLFVLEGTGNCFERGDLMIRFEMIQRNRCTMPRLMFNKLKRKKIEMVDLPFNA